MEKLGPRPVRQSTGTQDISSARAAVLEWLQMRPKGATVEDAASAFDLHPNTARDHLSGLVERGLAREARESVGHRGRPATRYYPESSNSEPDERVRHYAELVTVLASFVTSTSDDPKGAARTAGHSWGLQLGERSYSRRDAKPATIVANALDELGFAPRVNRAATEVRLTRCPLRDVATQYPDVICAIHEGVIDGILEQRHIDNIDVDLAPFHEPGACLVSLQARAK